MSVTGLRPHTKTFSQEARDRLGIAFARAREAAGYTSRPAFASVSRVGVTSLWKLESGKPVSAVVYEAAARALPNWTEDTPLSILRGEDAAPPAETPAATPAGPPSAPATTTPLTDEDEVRLRVLKDAINAGELTDELRWALLLHIFNAMGIKPTRAAVEAWLNNPDRLEAIRASQNRKETEQVTPRERT